MPEIILKELEKSYGRDKAIDKLSAKIEDSEFFVVVGPTACGKTTLLKLIAGLLKPDQGKIYFDGRTVGDLKPNERGVRMVFQDYALYPHLEIFNQGKYSNLSFALKIKNFSSIAIRKIVDSVAEKIGIKSNLYRRKPGQLSEGQKQKVALGKAVTLIPEVLLLDEPLSNLDPQNRLKARKEIKDLHQRLKATTIYVTHDLLEALLLGDRLAVMKEGRFIQVGPPQEIYDRPANAFIKSFIQSYETSLREAFPP